MSIICIMLCVLYVLLWPWLLQFVGFSLLASSKCWLQFVGFFKKKQKKTSFPSHFFMSLKRKRTSVVTYEQAMDDLLIVTQASSIQCVVNPYYPCSIRSLVVRYRRFRSKSLELLIEHLQMMDSDYKLRMSRDYYLYLCSYLFDSPDSIIYSNDIIYEPINYGVRYADDKCRLSFDYFQYHTKFQNMIHETDFEDDENNPYRSLKRYGNYSNHHDSVFKCVLKLTSYINAVSDSKNIKSITDHYRTRRMQFISLFLMCFKYSTNSFAMLRSTPPIRRLIMKAMITSYILDELIKEITSEKYTKETGWTTKADEWKDYVINKFNKLYSDLNKFKFN